MRKLISYLKIYTQDVVTYRVDILLFTISGIIQPLINIFVWLSVSGRAATPFSQSQFILYFVLVMLVGMWVSAWGGMFISGEIRQGDISTYLLKPVSFNMHQFAHNLAEKLLKTIYLLPIALLVLLYFQVPASSVNLTVWPLFIVSLLSAFCICFFLDICVGFSAFWLDDAAPLWDFFGISMFFFSGRFFFLWQ